MALNLEMLRKCVEMGAKAAFFADGEAILAEIERLTVERDNAREAARLLLTRKTPEQGCRYCEQDTEIERLQKLLEFEREATIKRCRELSP